MIFGAELANWWHVFVQFLQMVVQIVCVNLSSKMGLILQSDWSHIVLFPLPPKYDDASLGIWFPVFWYNIVASSSRVKIFKKNLRKQVVAWICRYSVTSDVLTGKVKGPTRQDKKQKSSNRVIGGVREQLPLPDQVVEPISHTLCSVHWWPTL